MRTVDLMSGHFERRRCRWVECQVSVRWQYGLIFACGLVDDVAPGWRDDEFVYVSVCVCVSRQWRGSRSCVWKEVDKIIAREDGNGFEYK